MPSSMRVIGVRRQNAGGVSDVEWEIFGLSSCFPWQLNLLQSLEIRLIKGCQNGRLMELEIWHSGTKSTCSWEYVLAEENTLLVIILKKNCIWVCSPSCLLWLTDWSIGSWKLIRTLSHFSLFLFYFYFYFFIS